MGAYLARRLATLPLLLLGISAVSFALLNLAPGDPAEIVLRQRNPGQLPNPAEVAAMRVELGLDASLPVQYARWVSRALVGDMGQSYVTEQPVASQLARRTVPTALLTATALGLALVVAVPMGILSARRRGGAVDAVARLAAAEADLALIVTDATTGPTELDRAVAREVLRAGRPHLLVVNKVDAPQYRDAVPEFYALGLGDPMAISAMHGTATGDLLDAIAERLPGSEYRAVADTRPRIAIVGRLNVGKL